MDDSWLVRHSDEALADTRGVFGANHDLLNSAQAQLDSSYSWVDILKW